MTNPKNTRQPENGLKSATPRLPPLTYGVDRSRRMNSNLRSCLRFVFHPLPKGYSQIVTIRVGMGDSLRTTNLTAVRFNCPIRPVTPIRFSLTTRSLQRLSCLKSHVGGTPISQNAYWGRCADWTRWCLSQSVLPSGDIGSPGVANRLCPGLDDFDMDGYTVAAGDCDDADPLVHPGAAEVWGLDG